MNPLKIASILDSNSAIYHKEGLKVFEELNKLLSKGEKVNLDFADLTHISTAFLNASLGNLYLEYKPEQLESLFTTSSTDLNLLDEKIKKVIEHATELDFHDQVIEDALACL